MIKIHKAEVPTAFVRAAGHFESTIANMVHGEVTWKTDPVRHYGMARQYGALKGILECLKSFNLKGEVMFVADNAKVDITGDVHVYDQEAVAIARLLEVQIVDGIFQARQFGVKFSLTIKWQQEINFILP